jgi:hypothetical protein
MPVTRTRISSDYVKSSTSPSSDSTKERTTRTRISSDYIKSSPSTCQPIGLQTHRTYVHVQPPAIVHHEPAYVHRHRVPVYVDHQPVIVDETPLVVQPQSQASYFRDIMKVVTTVAILTILGIAIYVYGTIPSCHIEEICENIGKGLQKCHQERVCSTWW